MDGPVLVEPARTESDSWRVFWEWCRNRPLAQFLYNHNPFYVISAALVFWGLRVSFDTTRGIAAAMPLMLGLAMFTLLLVGTAVAIIRIGRVWEDARSILLLVVLMFLGMSVTFDSILADRPDVARWYYLGGLAFAIGVTELALRGLPLRLPALYRLPFYAILSLFYLYPLLLSGRLTSPEDSILKWQLFGFSTAASLLFVSLIPAIRRGAAYANDERSPWRWPLFPWTLFGMLWLCVCLRAYYLCLSLHFVGYANSIFGGYFLVPMLLAAAALFVEGGQVSRSYWATRIGMLLPVVALVVAGVGHRRDWVYLDFLSQFREALHATPLFVALIGLIAFYTIAALRKVPWGSQLLILGVGGLTFINVQTLDLASMQLGAAWPLALVGGALLAVGLYHWQSHRVAIGACLLLMAATLHWQHTGFAAHGAAVPLHLLLAIFLGVGMLFKDDVARRLRRWGALMIPALVAWVLVDRSEQTADGLRWLMTLHGPAMAALALGCGIRWRLPRFHLASLAASGLWTAVVGTEGYSLARQHLAGLDQVSLGLLFFACAILISLAKARVLQRWLAELIRFWRTQFETTG